MQTKSPSLSADCCAPLEQLLTPKFFKALCDPNRIAILVRLASCREPSNVGQIAACCPIDLSVVSRHLAVLREAGIVEATRRGKEVFYAVRTGPLVDTLRSMADAIEACCPPSPESSTRDGGAR